MDSWLEASELLLVESLVLWIAFNYEPLLSHFVLIICVPFFAAIGGQEGVISVPSGSRNLDGMLILKVTKTWKDFMLSQIVQLTEEAYHNKPKLQRRLDEFGEQYSKVVMVLSVAITLLGPLIFKWPFLSILGCRDSIYIALELMVAASSCALAVAPLAYATAISSKDFAKPQEVHYDFPGLPSDGSWNSYTPRLLYRLVLRMLLYCPMGSSLKNISEIFSVWIDSIKPWKLNKEETAGLDASKKNPDKDSADLIQSLVKELGKSNPLVNLCIEVVEKSEDQYGSCAEDKLTYEKVQQSCPYEQHMA